jgi:hypothetical protein
MDLGTDSGTLGGAPFRAGGGDIIGGGRHADSDAARWVIRRFDVPRTLPATISMGLIAIGLLFPAEIAGVVWVRGLSLREYLASFVTSPGVISLLTFLVFGAMPTLVTLLTWLRRTPNLSQQSQ